MGFRSAGIAGVMIVGLAALRAEALTVESATHLLLRTGFGATPAEVAGFLPLTREQSVALLLLNAGTDPVTPLPSWSGDYLAPPRSDPKDPAATRAARDSYDSQVREREQDLLHWWFGEMISTHSPLTERLVLFWHGHFTSAMDKVDSPNLLLDQNLLLRRYALGSFRGLVHAIARDPAMLIYLDGEGSVKAHPNENFARELMELFTLGEGNYTEQDVREVARAFTGWRVDRATGLASFDERRHDAGSKTILGRTGNWDGDQAIDIILGQPQAARFIVAELWRELVSPDPDPRTVEALAASFRDADYAMRPLVRSLLLTDQFWAPSNWGTLVKSPVQLAVGTARLLGLDASAAPQVAAAVPPMGEQLLNPPTVKGWPTGDAWVTSATLVAREAALRRLPMPLLTAAAARLQAGVANLQARHEMSAGQGLETLLLPVPVVRADAAAAAPAGAGPAAGRGASMPVDPNAAARTLRAVLLNPLYQLM
ncbi:MAG TPA: DUF1800 domain-containing protein [Spirochaetia bacterium]|nr:DUF1800 domain-containing protein [Spirochaetia bacterium]